MNKRLKLLASWGILPVQRRCWLPPGPASVRQRIGTFAAVALLPPLVSSGRTGELLVFLLEAPRGKAAWA